jgi:hypothetical protein
MCTIKTHAGGQNEVSSLALANGQTLPRADFFGRHSMAMTFSPLFLVIPQNPLFLPVYNISCVGGETINDDIYILLLVPLC